MEKKDDSVIRIALLGPESTAKSSLTNILANYYGTVGVSEYAREYLANLNREYTLNDILLIGKEQLLQEQIALNTAAKFIFTDTELIILKVWSEDVFKSCPIWILENIEKFKYDFYLLMAPDIPWVEDPLRENPHRRDYLFDCYENELKKINANYSIIKGFGEKRFQNCLTAINDNFQ